MFEREQLFRDYEKTHARFVEDDAKGKHRFFRFYLRENYLWALPKRKDCKILDIGCSKGYLLRALANSGYENLTGVDLSVDELRIARQIVPKANIFEEDARTLLRRSKGEFDVIIMKAVLEHVEKDQVFPFLEEIKASLSGEGVFIVDVPNMDWLFAQHERYMDFTHEVGFTRESLGQVLRNVFGNSDVRKAINPLPVVSGRYKLFAKMAKKLFQRLILYVDLDGSLTWWDARSIIGVCRTK